MSVAEEVKALRASAGLSWCSHVAAVHVEGPDAFDLLQSASSRSPYRREGRVAHTLLLRDDRGVYADAFVVLADDGFVVLSEGPDERELIAWLDGLKERRPSPSQAAIRGMAADWVILGVDGPYGWEVVAGLLGPAVVGMPYLSLLRCDDILCVRAGKTGEYGYLLLVPRSSAPDVEARLFEIGVPLDVLRVGRDALDVCALESSHFTMRSVRETSLATPLTPIELQLQWRVAYGREFVGAAALRSRRAEGPKVRVTCFLADVPVGAGQPIRLGGEEVGEVLAACLSPTLGRTIGSALLHLRFAHPHLRLSAEAGTGAAPLVTATGPLVDNLSLRVDPHKHAYARPPGEAPSPEPPR